MMGWGGDGVREGGGVEGGGGVREAVEGGRGGGREGVEGGRGGGREGVEGGRGWREGGGGERGGGGRGNIVNSTYLNLDFSSLRVFNIEQKAGIELGLQSVSLNRCGSPGVAHCD